VNRVAIAVVKNKTRVIDIDLKSYFDNVRHDKLLKKVAKRVNDDKTMKLLKLILKASGKIGVPQGGVISPLLANIYLDDVDKMLERAKEVTRREKYYHIEYARFADDVVILVDGFQKWNWLVNTVYKRLLEELGKLDIQINQEKSRIVDLTQDETFNFLGFNFRRIKTRQGKWGVNYMPTNKVKVVLLKKLKEVFRKYDSQPVGRIIEEVNPILRGWVNYFRIGHSSRCFGYIKDYTEKKIRRHLMHAKKRHGFGWKRWSKTYIYEILGLFRDYRIKYYMEGLKA
jgi:RNA-directed DNA polymerase